MWGFFKVILQKNYFYCQIDIYKKCSWAISNYWKLVLFFMRMYNYLKSDVGNES